MHSVLVGAIFVFLEYPYSANLFKQTVIVCFALHTVEIKFRKQHIRRLTTCAILRISVKMSIYRYLIAIA